jgi:hypothetical protein
MDHLLSPALFASNAVPFVHRIRGLLPQQLEVRGAPLFGVSASAEMLSHLCRQKTLNFNIFVNQGPVNANTIANQFPLCALF